MTDPESASTPRGGQTAARMRAAFAYADLKRPAVAAALGVSVETVSRWTAGVGGPPSREVRERVAHLTGVPLSFITDGFVDPEELAAERMPAVIEEIVGDDRVLDALAGRLADRLGLETDPGDRQPAPLEERTRAAVRRLGSAGAPKAPDQRSQRPGRP